MLYALRVLRARGTPTTSLHDIFHAIVLSRIEYAAPAWSAMYLAANHASLDSLLPRSERLGTAAMIYQPLPTCSVPRTTTPSHHIELCVITYYTCYNYYVQLCCCSG